MSEKIVQLNEEVIKGQIKELVRGSVEETLNGLLEAEAEKQSQILRAEAVKESKIREAEGEAAAILAIQKATADGIRMINEADPSQSVIAIKGLEAFAKAADGKATKIIIPSEIQGLAGLVTSVKEIGASDNN